MTSMGHLVGRNTHLYPQGFPVEESDVLDEDTYWGRHRTFQGWMRPHRTGKWGRDPQSGPGPQHCHLDLGWLVKRLLACPPSDSSCLALRSQTLKDLSCMAIVEMSTWVAKGLLPLSLIRKHCPLYNHLPEHRSLSSLGKTPSP